MNLIRIALFILAASLFCACKQKARDLSRTVITGTVANRDNDTSITAFTLTVADFGGSPTTYTGTIQNDGTFKIAFEQHIAQDVMLTPIVKKLIAHPGDSIHIDLDLKDIGNAKFSGDAQKLNNDLFHYANEYYSTANIDLDTGKMNTDDTLTYRVYCQNMRAELQNNRQDFISKFEPDEELISWTENYVNAEYYLECANQIATRDRYKGARNAPVKELSKLPGYEKDMNQLFDAKILVSGVYKLAPFLIPLSDDEAAAGRTQQETVELYLAKIAHDVKNQRMKQLLMGQFFYYNLASDDIDGFDVHRKFFDTYIKVPFIKYPLLRYYATVKHNTTDPGDLSDAILNSIKATPAQGLIDSIRKEHSGKVIYIDMWATWCGPCRSQMPYSEKLAQWYKNKNVKFVYLCIGSKRGAWLKTLPGLNLSGQQYFCDDAQSKSLARDLKVSAVPFYMIINTKGQIVDMGNHLRPSDPLTQRKLDKLLQNG